MKMMLFVIYNHHIFGSRGHHWKDTVALPRELPLPTGFNYILADQANTRSCASSRL